MILKKKRKVADWIIRNTICRVVGHKMIISLTSIEDESYYWRHNYCCRCNEGSSDTIAIDVIFHGDEKDG